MSKITTNLLQTISMMGLLLLAVACVERTDATSNEEQNTMATETTTNTETSDLYNFKMKSIDGKDVDFAQYKGKKLLLVNVASECGYTKQYADLQKLHETHGNDIVILGFPANNFGGQEPGSNEEIASFCEKNFGVSFPLFEKISVVGDDQHPLYTWLKQQAPANEEPSWNFSKYLIDENGEVVAFYPSKVNPMGEEVLAFVQQ